MNYIVNGKIITKDSVVLNKVIAFDSRIVDIIDVDNFKPNKEDEVIDAAGKFVSPGFIDMHIHGSGGKDTMDGEIESIKTISSAVAKKGVTSFLPTTMTMDKETIYRALAVVKECINLKLPGAKVLGAHMEGPFISEKYKGAQSEKFIEKPDYNFINEFKDIIKVITMAPENDENFHFIEEVKKNTEIILSIGHSDASYECALEAIKKGISHATHTFNAMSPFNHRKPGVVGAVFNSDIMSELIADTIHVHKDIFNLLIKIKGIDKVALITDSMEAGCMKDGKWKLGGQEVIVKEGTARLSDGTLAGSVLTLNKAVKNILDNTNLKLWEAVRMASLNQAKELRLDDKKGSIEIGKDSDIIIFDEDVEIYTTIVAGEIVYCR